DRRRGRKKKVRIGARSLLAERRALADAKAVLLVDDGEAEPLERDVLLDEGMRADGDVDRSIGESREDVPAAVPGHARGEERVGRSSVGEEHREGPRVLL